MKKLILSCSLLALTAPAYAALDCAPLPDCEDFGYTYTADDCDGQSTLKCPFDQTKLYCTEPGGKQATAAPCRIGSILYNDLKCYDEAPEGKTAIAVVFDVSKRLAISLYVFSNISWGGHGTDLPELDNCIRPNDTDNTCGTDGKSNTQKIVAQLGSDKSNYAAGYCYNLTIGGMPKGSWFLPSVSELITLSNYYPAVNKGVEKSGIGYAYRVSDKSYWSSNEYDRFEAFYMHLSGFNSYAYGDSKNDVHYARCAIAY